MSDDARQRLSDLERAVLELVSIAQWTLAYVKRAGSAHDIAALQKRLDLVADLLIEEGTP